MKHSINGPPERRVKQTDHVFCVHYSLDVQQFDIRYWVRADKLPAAETTKPAISL